MIADRYAVAAAVVATAVGLDVENKREGSLDVQLKVGRSCNSCGWIVVVLDQAKERQSASASLPDC